MAAKRGRPAQRYDWGLIVWLVLWKAKKKKELLSFDELMARTSLTRSQVRLGLQEARRDMQVAKQQPIAVARVGQRQFYFLPGTVEELHAYALTRARDARSRIHSACDLIESAYGLSGDPRYKRILRRLVVVRDDIDDVVVDSEKLVATR